MDLAIFGPGASGADRRRWRRFARFALIAGGGLAVLAPLQVFWRLCRPRAPTPIVTIYHRMLARALGFRVEIVGGADPQALRVANHVSWADIVALGAIAPTAFVARGDLAHWPVLGRLARLAGTLFVARDRRRTAPDQVAALEAALRHGSVTLFPEGTTGDGHALLPFRSALFAGADRVQPVSLAWAPAGRSWRPGERSAFAWDGDKAFLPHARAVIGGDAMVCRVTFHPAFDVGGDRKAAAMRARACIAAALDAG